MSPRRRIQTDVPETEVPDGCLVDGDRRMSPRRRFQTDAPRRRIETDAPKTEDPDGCP